MTLEWIKRSTGMHIYIAPADATPRKRKGGKGAEAVVEMTLPRR